MVINDARWVKMMMKKRLRYMARQTREAQPLPGRWRCDRENSFVPTRNHSTSWKEESHVYDQGEGTGSVK